MFSLLITCFLYRCKGRYFSKRNYKHILMTAFSWMVMIINQIVVWVRWNQALCPYIYILLKMLMMHITAVCRHLEERHLISALYVIWFFFYSSKLVKKFYYICLNCNLTTAYLMLLTCHLFNLLSKGSYRSLNCQFTIEVSFWFFNYHQSMHVVIIN